MSLLKVISGAAGLGVLLSAGLVSAFVAGLDARASKVEAGVLGAETWDPKTGQWAPAGAIDAPRVASDLVPLPDGQVLVVGGFWDTTPVTTSLLWSPASRTFEQAWPPEIAIECRTAIPLADGRVLFASASEAANWGIGAYHAEVWDPKTDKGVRVAMTPDRGVRALVRLDDLRVLFVFKSFAAIWNTETREWTRGPGAVNGDGELDCADSARALLLSDGRVLVVTRAIHVGVGGWAWVWQPTSNALTPATALERALVAAGPASAGEGVEVDIDQLSRSPRGEIVLLGGTATYVASAALDKVAVIPLPAGHTGAAAVLVGGTVVLAGGSRGGAPTANVDTVDLGTKHAARTGTLATKRWGGSATALADGRVLVLGGTDVKWVVTWGRFVLLAAMGLGVLGVLAGLARLAKRSGRWKLVVGVALGTGALIAAAAGVAWLAAVGSAIRG